MKSVKYITVVDAEGATMGYGGAFISISHRFMWDGMIVYGAESLLKQFPNEQTAIDHMRRFTSEPTGTLGRFAWTVE